MDIKALAEACEPYIIDRRRYYHACPEVSTQEKETRAAVKRDLEALGITDIREMKECYGLIATIHGGRPGKTIALRTDIDGLGMPEKTGLPFASCNGNMHACGHDCHIAMLLGAAKILNEHREELAGDVRLIVQPAEEIAMGARWMMREHAMDGVDAIYGSHIWGNLDAPLIDVTVGNRMAGADLVTIEVEGVSAHGSAPHLGTDAITVACNIVVNLQQIVSRMNDPLNPLVITMGEFEGGPRFNVIPNHVRLYGTVRSFLRDDWLERTIRRVAENTAAAFGAKITYKYEYMTPPVINRDEQLNRIAHDAVVKLYGQESIGHLQTMMGSEDFPLLCPDIPFFFAFLGSRNAEKGLTYTNHQEQYDVDEDVLKRGTAMMVQVACDYLAENSK